MIFSKLQNKFIEKFQNWVNEEYLPLVNVERFSSRFSIKENESFYYYFLDIEIYNNNSEIRSLLKYNDFRNYIHYLYQQGFSFESLIYDRISNIKRFECLYPFIKRKTLVIRISKKYKNLEFYLKIENFEFVKNSDIKKKNFRVINDFFLKSKIYKKFKISNNDQVTVYNMFNKPQYISHKSLQYFDDKIIGFNEFPIRNFLEFLLMGHLGIDKVLLQGDSLLNISNKFAKNTTGKRDIINKINPVFGALPIYDLIVTKCGFQFVFLISRIFNENDSKEFCEFYKNYINSQIDLPKNILEVITIFFLAKNNYIKLNDYNIEWIKLYEKHIAEIRSYIILVITYIRKNLIFHVDTKLHNQFLIFKAKETIIKKRICFFKNESDSYQYLKKHQKKLENCLIKSGVQITFLKSTYQLLKMFNSYPFLSLQDNQHSFIEVRVPKEKLVFLLTLSNINLPSKKVDIRMAYIHSSMRKNAKHFSVIDQVVCKLNNEINNLHILYNNKKSKIREVEINSEMDLPF